VSYNVFVGRTALLADIVNGLDDQSIALVGPRRIGKTELLKQLERNQQGPWKAVRVDLEGARSWQDAHDELRDRLVQAVAWTSKKLDKHLK
jgi:predicted AAA+ superfamily ATPase